MFARVLRTLLFVSITAFDVCFGILSAAGVSQSFTFATKEKVYGTQIYWKRENEESNIFSCTTFPLYCDKNTDLYTVNVSSNASSFISTFTIRSVTPLENNTKWICEATFRKITDEEKENAEYILEVFATAKYSTCENAELLSGSTRLQIKCFTPEVFPESICVFFVKTNATKEYALSQGAISYSSENTTMGYYKTNCTYSMPAASLGPGYHNFRVDVYPKITANVTHEMITTVQVMATIDLLYPKALLGSDCQTNGYIKEKVKMNCTCYNNNTSIQPTEIIWTKNGSQMSTTKTLFYESIRNVSYTCFISNKLNWTDSIIFQPNVSYPPNILALNITDHSLNLCIDREVTIKGTCLVGESNPSSSVYLIINNSLTEIKSQTRNIEYTFNKTEATAGKLYFSCLANSTEFNISTLTTTEVTVKGPPDSPTFFINKRAVTNSQSKNFFEVKNGDEITCQSKGGYPFQKNLSLRCGQEEEIVSNLDQVVLTLNTSSVTMETCECTVLHENTCTQNRSIIELKFSKTASDNNLEGIFIGVGITAGSILTISFLLLITFILRKYWMKTRSSEITEKLVNNKELYFIKEENSTMISSMYPSYTNVVTTMSSATEPPKKI